MGNKGFTLMEIMVVVAIIGIMSSIAIPNMFLWINNAKIRAEIFQFELNCKKARSLAITQNKNVVLAITQNKYHFWVDGDPDYQYDNGYDNDGDDKRDDNFTDVLINSVDVVSVKIGTNNTTVDVSIDNNTKGAVAFNSKGMCVLEGNTFITPMVEVIFRSGSNMFKVDFILTGLTHTYRSTDNGLTWI